MNLFNKDACHACCDCLGAGHTFTREEVQAFLATMQWHYLRYQPLFLCALRTGMRQGELVGLQWGDVDFHGGFIELRRSHFKGRLDTTKNRKARLIYLSRQLGEPGICERPDGPSLDSNTG